MKYSRQGEDFNLAVQHSAVDGLSTMFFASISNVFKTSSGNHYNYNVNNSNQRVNRWSTSIENVVNNSRSFKPKVYAPSKPKPVPKPLPKNRHSVGLVVAQQEISIGNAAVRLIIDRD